MNEENLVIYQKWLDVAKDAYNLLKRFPKEEKFILAAQIRDAVINVGTLIIEVNEERSPHAKNEKANALDRAIKKVRTLFRLAEEFEYISHKNYLTICAKGIEVGRILGGRKRSFPQL